MGFFSLTNGKQFNIGNIQAGIKIEENNVFLMKYDANKNSIFDNEELRQLQEDIEPYAGDGKLENAEYISLYAKVMGMTVEAVKQLFSTGEKSEEDITELLNMSFSSMEEAQAHNECIDIIRNSAYTATADMLLEEKNSISKLYDNWKNNSVTYDIYKTLVGSDKLSTNEIYKKILKEAFTADFLEKAERGELTRAEYVQKKIESVKALCMIKIVRENLEDVKKWAKEHGIANFNEEKFIKYMDAYMTNNLYNMVSAAAHQADESGHNFEAALDSINKWVDYVLSQDEETSKEYFAKVCAQAIEKPTKRSDIVAIESVNSLSFDETEKLTFDQVFKLERQQDFDTDDFNAYKEAKRDMQIISGAYNKLSVTISSIDELKEVMNPKITDKEYWTGINSGEMLDKKIKDIVEMFSGYYMGNTELASEDLNKLGISGLIIKANDNGALSIELDDTLDTTAKKDEALNNLLDKFKTAISKRFEKVLGDKTLDDYIERFNRARDKAVGGTELKGLVSAYQGDNGTVIDRAAGVGRTAGMVLTVTGGLLCLTPAAATGIPEAMTSIGGNLVIGTMGLEYEAKYLEFYTQEEITDEDLEDLKNLNKHFILDAGGMIIGIKAGKTGNKAFGKLLDKKLAQSLGKNVTEGNRIQVLKEVIKDKAALKNLLQAFNGKVSTDFLISYAGDLVMTGVLDIEDADWLTLLKSNLMGIAIGTASDMTNIGHSELKQKRVKELKEQRANGAIDAKGLNELSVLEKELANAGTEKTKPDDTKSDGVKPAEIKISRKIETEIDLYKTSYETYTDRDGNKVYKVVAASSPNERHGGYDFTYNVWKVDRDGNVIDELKGVTDKTIKEKFGRLKNREIHDNSNSVNSGYAYSGIPFFEKLFNRTGTTEPAVTKSKTSRKVLINNSEAKVIGTVNGKPVTAKYLPLDSDARTFCVEIDGKKYKVAAGKSKKINDAITLTCDKYFAYVEIKPENTTSQYVYTERTHKPEVDSQHPVLNRKTSEPATALKQSSSAVGEGTSKSSLKLADKRKKVTLTELPDNYNLKNIANSNIEDGSVFTQNGKLYIRNGNEAVELNISPETFLRLFPHESLNFQQFHTCTCYFLSTLENAFETPLGKTNILKLFSEDSEGNLSITFGTSRPIEFTKGIPLSLDNGVKNATSDFGVKLLEQAFGINLAGLDNSTSTREPLKTAKIKRSNIEVIRDALAKMSDNGYVNILFGATNSKYATVAWSDRSPDKFTNVIRTYGNSSVRKLQIVSTELAHMCAIKGYEIIDGTEYVYVSDPYSANLYPKLVQLDELLSKQVCLYWSDWGDVKAPQSTQSAAKSAETNNSTGSNSTDKVQFTPSGLKIPDGYKIIRTEFCKGKERIIIENDLGEQMFEGDGFWGSRI